MLVAHALGESAPSAARARALRRQHPGAGSHREKSSRRCSSSTAAASPQSPSRGPVAPQIDRWMAGMDLDCKDYRP